MIPPDHAPSFPRLSRPGSGASWRAPLLALAVLAGAGKLPASVDQAWDQMRLGHWDEAEKNLADVPSLDAGAVCRTRFAEGMLWQNRRPGSDPAKAAAAYEWILQNHPQDPMAPWALLELARMPDLDVLNPRLEEAIPIYQRLMSEYPQSAAAQEAALFLGDALFAARGEAGAQEAVAMLEEWMKGHPDPDYRSTGELLLGKLNRYPLKNYPEAVRHLRAALDAGLRSSSERLIAYWTIATLAERELKDRNLAVQYYTGLLDEFPHHRTAYMAKQRLLALGAPVPEIEDPGAEVKP